MSENDGNKPAQDETGRAGAEYLQRMVKGIPRLPFEEVVVVAKAVDKAVAIATRMAAMRDLRAAVDALNKVRLVEPSVGLEFEQADPVLRLLEEADDEVKRFLAACAPLFTLIPTLMPTLMAAAERLDGYLDENDAIGANLQSFTKRQLAALAVARLEATKKISVRLEPKEFKELLWQLDVLEGESITVSACEELLWKMRGKRDGGGQALSHQDRGALLSDLEFATSMRNAPSAAASVHQDEGISAESGSKDTSAIGAAAGSSEPSDP